MSLSRPLVALMGAGVLGIALVGAGAGATFTTATTSSQTITAGTADVSLSSPQVAGCTSSADHCHSLQLPAVGPVGSTFETNNNTITITNTGNIPVTEAAINLSDTHGTSTASAYLRSELNVCIFSTPWVVANGPLTRGESLHPSVLLNPVVLQPGDTDTYKLDFYAGQDSTSCGTISSSGGHTATAWGAYTTPASLTNQAEGGVVTPIMTFDYTG